ncbi:class I SAM-dependent methyltransferase [Jeotgalibacillus sp. ET6]|uniref:class I SAM-dependent methyltransferase n=1 Tax=Jeotgalibacillus sp. ET6 TaxID=3037260 RepID=UPI0024182533|nr:class I SAM-dependent methyltransferase [Jeotgalibacillus sp. ET6]MDG5471344.1 class I SAM-dependent methyltransferase [Jeotgalibacillus sp. ET6]
MEYRGPNAYDQEAFFSNYMKRRSRKDSPNQAIETPIIYELLGDFQDQTILDIGCGDASFGKELLEKGAASYTGIEGSRQMAEAAKENLASLNGEVLHFTMEAYDYPEHTYDIITSRFVIHYAACLEELFQNIHQSLKEVGRFIFSVQHPLTTASFLSKKEGDRRGNWIVDDYFIEGERKEPWLNETVVKYHRTVEHYFSSLTHAGFTVTNLREGKPERKNFTDETEYERRLRIPVVLAFSCVKSATLHT